MTWNSKHLLPWGYSAMTHSMSGEHLTPETTTSHAGSKTNGVLTRVSSRFSEVSIAYKYGRTKRCSSKTQFPTQLKSPTTRDPFCCCLTVGSEACSFVAVLRVWFNGRMKASQALDGGSIPLTRFLAESITTRPLSAGFVSLSTPAGRSGHDRFAQCYENGMC